MNADRFEGLYRQIKGRIMIAWGRLTNDRSIVLRGRATALSGAAQSDFGRAMRATRMLGLRRRLGV